MSSKINGFDSRPIPLGASRPVERPRDATAGPQAETAQGRGIRITERASQLAALEQALQEMPAVDAARVAEIRSAIEAGRYSVSAEHVADRLLQLEQALAPLGEREK